MHTERLLVGLSAGAIVAAFAIPARGDELSAATAGERSVRASYDAVAARKAKGAADARVDQATYAFLPRLTASARYARLSDFTPSPLFPFGLAATEAPAGTASPPAVATGPVSLSPILDNYALDLSLNVPLSDYVLRLARNLAAAKHGRDAAEWETVVADSRARLAGKIAFYEWIRTNASLDAARQSVAEQRAHLADVTNQAAQGNASRADALRVDSAVAGAEASLAEASAALATAETRLRTLLHVAGSAGLTTREAVDAPLDQVVGGRDEWLVEAYRSRAELRGLEAAESSARAQASAARSAYVPTVGAFASATYANPNPRYFPPEAVWHGTWAVGAAVTWTPTDIPGARAGASEADARGDTLAAQRSALRDALNIEVVQAFEAVSAADAKVIATDKQLASAAEAYRVTRSLFGNARATTSNVLDAETDLARARLAWVNARIDAREARARLEHAAGRDQRHLAP